ncbi:MAG TPA: efflux RND transporter periplasmic adaptor subunit [Anaerolineales bacterium]|nr:efflux RND transporter periplasmic adaptor subunit [Anaerolineales bacterium]
MKRLYWLRLISSSLIAIILINPGSVRAVFASGGNNPGFAQKAVSASAVVVPAHVAQLGFLISAIAREIPVKEGDPVKAGQTLMVLDTPDLRFAVVEAQAALHSAQSYADLQKYQKVKNRRLGRVFFDTLAQEYTQRANVKVQQAQVALEIAQFNLTQATLTAPFDGTVASISVIPGEFVPSDQAVLTLATLNALQIETTDLSERDIAKVKIGAPVNISIEAAHENFTGKVIGISPVADTVGGDVVFKVTIAFDQQPENLRWGMTTEVTIAE